MTADTSFDSLAPPDPDPALATAAKNIEEILNTAHGLQLNLIQKTRIRSYGNGII